MFRLRLISLLLILSLGLSAVGFGMAIGQAPAAGQIVICSGHGLLTVSVDADGKPVESLTLCPDAVASLMAATAVSPTKVVAGDMMVSQCNWPSARLDQCAVAVPHGIGARDPPVA
ncbi:hypothetical protein CLV78_102666 [Aliiruegeria haliotis]|uniref:DUF2946 family protein n=1 Tax=Aliiruegeria haliotis TaxID=1280846 RepID=A0A2T0RWB7_9RHOB|nr:hypothetical protein [Aliiruegeria haliotis]PRY25486.1 hypothetical protein CLV78_102666 [Aliiruegeria haliotis]